MSHNTTNNMKIFKEIQKHLLKALFHSLLLGNINELLHGSNKHFIKHL